MTKLIFLTIFCCFVVAALGIKEEQEGEYFSSEKFIQKRIIGGNTITEKGKWPWLVSLQADVPVTKFLGITIQSRLLYCGGSVINSRWILSAAHCFKMIDKADNPENWKARVAEVKLNAGFTDWVKHLAGKALNKNKWKQWNIHASKIILHPNYLNSMQDRWPNDIALVKLNKDIPVSELRNVERIQLPEQGNSDFPAESDACVMTGWGCNQKGKTVAKRAMEINLPKVSDRKCRFTYDMISRLCAGYFDANKGICQGDSGGPLVCKNSTSGRWVQVGVASFTSSSPSKHPGVFTRVSQYVDWIKTTIANN